MNRPCTCGAVVLTHGVYVDIRPSGTHRPDPEDCEVRQ